MFGLLRTNQEKYENQLGKILYAMVRQMEALDKEYTKCLPRHVGLHVSAKPSTALSAMFAAQTIGVLHFFTYTKDERSKISLSQFDELEERFLNFALIEYPMKINAASSPEQLAYWAEKVRSDYGELRANILGLSELMFNNDFINNDLQYIIGMAEITVGVMADEEIGRDTAVKIADDVYDVYGETLKAIGIRLMKLPKH